MTEEFDINDFIYLPTRATSVAVREVERRRTAKYRLDWGIPEIDARWVPPVPGEMICMMGLPGHAKTTTMIALARRWANQVRVRKDKHGRAPLIIYATWETTIEEFALVFTAKDSGETLESIGRGLADQKRIERALVEMLATNVALIGSSGETRRNMRAQPRNRSPMPTITDLDLCLQRLIEQEFEIAAVFVDYLQRIPSEKGWGSHNDRTQIVSENTSRLKDLAIVCDIPIVCGVQARREVGAYKGLKVPGPQDAQHSSSIEQDCDKLLSFSRPAKFMEIGDEFDGNEFKYKVEPGTMVVQLLKQRWGPQELGDVWVLDYDFAKATMVPQRIIGEAEPY